MLEHSAAHAGDSSTYMTDSPRQRDKDNTFFTQMQVKSLGRNFLSGAVVQGTSLHSGVFLSDYGRDAEGRVTPTPAARDSTYKPFYIQKGNQL